MIYEGIPIKPVDTSSQAVSARGGVQRFERSCPMNYSGIFWETETRSFFAILEVLSKLRRNQKGSAAEKE
jgi:hypothetical protein